MSTNTTPNRPTDLLPTPPTAPGNGGAALPVPKRQYEPRSRNPIHYVDPERHREKNGGVKRLHAQRRQYLEGPAYREYPKRCNAWAPWHKPLAEWQAEAFGDEAQAAA